MKTTAKFISNCSEMQVVSSSLLNIVKYGSVCKPIAKSLVYVEAGPSSCSDVMLSGNLGQNHSTQNIKSPSYSVTYQVAK